MLAARALRANGAQFNFVVRDGVNGCVHGQQH
jgi:hypothetical protein